jgi:Protein of unknown function (DUF732)/Protein of unknown function (DUF2510)
MNTMPSPRPGWYPDPAGGAGRRYWDGTRWCAPVPAPATPPKPVNWPLLIAIAAPLVLVLIVVGIWSDKTATPQQQDYDDAYIHALTTGRGVRADPAWVRSMNRDELIAAGRYVCDRLNAGDGSIEAGYKAMKRFDLPPGNTAVGVEHAATEVYCPEAPVTGR